MGPSGGPRYSQVMRASGMRFTMGRPVMAAVAVAGLAVGGCTAGGAGPVTTRAASTSAATTSATASSRASATTSATTPVATASGSATGHPVPGMPRPEHVVVVVMENHAAGRIIGSADAPYITSLARTGASFTQSYAVTHPSQPNYLALFSGSTHGVQDDGCPQALTGPNLATALRAAGRSFVGYSEGLPGPGFRGCEAGAYARKHNPWVDFAAVPSTANQPLTSFPTDFAGLPSLAFVVPDLTHDMHDGTVASGDAWLSQHVGAYVRWAMTHHSVLVLTFDEDDNNHDNRIATVVVGDHVRPGPFTERVDHYRVLRMLCDLLGVRPMGRSAGTTPVTGIWTS